MKESVNAMGSVQVRKEKKRYEEKNIDERRAQVWGEEYWCEENVACSEIAEEAGNIEDYKYDEYLKGTGPKR